MIYNVVFLLYWLWIVVHFIYMNLSTQVANFKRETITVKLVILGAMVLATLIPLTIVGGLISDRANRQSQVESEITDKWAREQTVYGAALSFPYMHTVYDETAEGRRVNSRLEQRYMHVLPTDMKVTATIVPEIRSRGIFSAVVYTAEVQVEGSFDVNGIAATGTAPARVFDNNPVLSIGVDDLGGIRELSNVTVNNAQYTLASGIPTTDVFTGGVSSRIPRSASGTYTFAYTQSLRGSGSLFVAPLAQTTNATFTSTYAAPSFIGSFLPDTREVTGDGFTAAYTVLEVNRSIPHAFDGALMGPRAVPLPYVKEVAYAGEQADRYTSYTQPQIVTTSQTADLSTFGVTLRPEVSSYDKLVR